MGIVRGYNLKGHSRTWRKPGMACMEVTVELSIPRLRDTKDTQIQIATHFQ